MWSIFGLVPWSAQSSDTPVDSSVSEAPKTAVVGFYVSLAGEDVERAAGFVMQPDKMKEWIRSQTELSAAFKRWNKAVADKLGDSGSSIIMPNPIELVADRSRSVDAQVKGDLAEFPVAKNKGLKLRRIANDWKLDIFSAYNTPQALKLLGVNTGEEALSLVTLKAREESKMINTVAAEINTGLLTTPNQVRRRLRSERDAMNERMLKAIRKATEDKGRRSE